MTQPKGSLSDDNEPVFYVVDEPTPPEPGVPGTGMTEAQAREFLSQKVPPVRRSTGNERSGQ